MQKAPGVKVRLSGINGNVFNVIGVVSRALTKAGFEELAKEYRDTCFKAKSYDEVLQYTMSIVDVS